MTLLSQLTAAARQPKEQMLFEFSAAEASKQWQVVKDEVMGGRSDGRFRIDGNGMIAFFGTLSLENNGGFASVRSRARPLGLQDGDSLVTRLRGDGWRCTLNLYVPRRRMAFSYPVEFQTKKDEWMEIRVPLKEFVATSFGRGMNDFGPVNPQQVSSIGLLLGDKKPGPFKLEVDWIQAVATRSSNSKQIVGSR
jgi:monofunctional biosynthetic peptidoglycan transglycosylase